MSKELNCVTDIDHSMSKDITQLYYAAAVENANEALTVFIHACMLQYGFIPKGVSNEDKYTVMPKDWNAKEVFKIKYVHFCCPPFTCCVTCVPLYNNISVHGIVSDIECSESVSLQLKMDDYLIQKKAFSNASEVFRNVEELSIYLKDNFCLPLLNLLHETHGKQRLYGFPGLFDEIKMSILKLLPVGGVVSMSAVNKNFHELSSTPALWKHLYQRDYCKGAEPDHFLDNATPSKTYFKELYKTEYIRLKRKARGTVFMLPRSRLPQIFSVGPDFDTDYPMGGYDPLFHGPGLIQPLPHLPPHFFRRY